MCFSLRYHRFALSKPFASHPLSNLTIENVVSIRMACGKCPLSDMFLYILVIYELDFSLGMPIKRQETEQQPIQLALGSLAQKLHTKVKFNTHTYNLCVPAQKHRNPSEISNINLKKNESTNQQTNKIPSSLPINNRVQELLYESV